MNGIIFEHNIPNNPTANYINNRIPRKGNDDSVFDFHLNTDNTDININNDNNIINNINNDNDINNYNNNIPYELLYNEKVDFKKYLKFLDVRFSITFLNNFIKNCQTLLFQVFLSVMIKIPLLTKYTILLIIKLSFPVRLSFLRILPVIYLSFFYS